MATVEDFLDFLAEKVGVERDGLNFEHSVELVVFDDDVGEWVSPAESELTNVDIKKGKVRLRRDESLPPAPGPPPSPPPEDDAVMEETEKNSADDDEPEVVEAPAPAQPADVLPEDLIP